MAAATRFLLCTTLALLALAAGASAQNLDDPGMQGTIVTINLTNGDTVTGRLVNNQGLDIVLDHDLLGRMVIPRTTILIEEDEAKEVAPVEPASPWSGSIDGRASGSSGNTSEHKYGGEFNMKREDDDGIHSVLMTYEKESAKRTPGKNTTKDQFYARYRYEWKIAQSRWRPFTQAAVDIDEFRDFDYRAEAAAGVGYLFLEEDDERLLGRIGAGASRKKGAADNDDVNYELLFGLDYAIDITDTNHFFVETTVFPSVNETGDYRAFTKGEWRLDLSDQSQWYFKVGADHTYDNTPDPGEDRGDFNYYAGVGARF